MGQKINFLGLKIAESKYYIITLLHKFVSRFIPILKKSPKNTLSKIDDFWGHLRGDIIIYYVYNIFFRRDIPFTLFFM